MIVTDILLKAKCKDKDTWVEGFYFNMPDKTRRYEERRCYQELLKNI